MNVRLAQINPEGRALPNSATGSFQRIQNQQNQRIENVQRPASLQALPSRPNHSLPSHLKKPLSSYAKSPFASLAKSPLSSYPKQALPGHPNQPQPGHAKIALPNPSRNPLPNRPDHQRPADRSRMLNGRQRLGAKQLFANNFKINRVVFVESDSDEESYPKSAQRTNVAKGESL